jgi:hypothetical protein
VHTGEDKGEDGCANGDEQDAEVKQVTSELADNGVGSEHAEDHSGDHWGEREASVDR